MESPPSDCFGIFEIYRRYCDIKAGNKTFFEKDHYGRAVTINPDFARTALAELSKLVETTFLPRFSVFDELSKLMTAHVLNVDYTEFARFYDFVYFLCRENGQKNITVSRAITAWKLVLNGRFRLLNQWCDFVQKNQRHNISEDTWQQVLAFSRCVHENLEGYDPEGAWPVLIDDFVEHMYRILGSNDNTNFCNCGDNSKTSNDDPLPGLRNVPGLKRKSSDIQDEEMQPSETLVTVSEWKKFRTSRGSSCSPTKSNCASVRCLANGFAGLFKTHPYFSIRPHES